MNWFVTLCVVTLASCYVVTGDVDVEAKSVISATNITEHSMQKKISLEEVKRDWTKLKEMLDEVFSALGRFLYSETVKLGAGNTTISIPCQRSLIKWFAGIKKSKSWAIKMLDAWGKPPGGIIRGSLTWLGSYDECVQIFKDRKPARNDFGSHYCPTDLWISMPERKPWYTTYEIPEEINIFSKDHVITDLIEYSLFFHMIPLRIGLCVPSTCKSNDITEIIHSSFTITKNSHFKINVLECQNGTEVKYSSLQIGVITTLAICGIVVIIGTAVDIWQKPTLTSDRGTWSKVLVNFSAYTNTRKLFNTDMNEDTMGFFHGLRFLTVLWVIWSHTYLYSQYRFFKGAAHYRQSAGFFFTNFINNGFLSVETFFFMSSFLAAYWRTKNQHITLNIPMYIFHRLWRILPAYLLALGLMFITPLFGAGPVWNEMMDMYVEPCKRNWWTNILFINNFVHVDDICLEPSWYLATEMQLYILFLVVILPLPRWPKAAMLVNFFLLALSITATTLVNLYKGLPPTGLGLYPDPRDRNTFAHEQYFKPYAHVGSYCVGMAAGYFVATSSKIKIKKYVRVLLWCISFSTMAFVLFIIREWNLGHHLGLIESTIYAALHRLLWILAVAWIAVNCCTGSGGIVNSVLSWKAFVPLSRLSFMIYLIHPIIQWAFIGYTRERVAGVHLTFIYWFFGHVVVSLFLGYLCTLLTEAPSLNIEKFLLKSKIQENQKPKEDKKQPNGPSNCQSSGSIRL